MEDLIVKLAPELSGLPVGMPDYISDGDKWLEPIENILTHFSCDGASPDGSGYGGDWDTVLTNKRKDSNYYMIIESIAEYGFVRPVTVAITVNGSDDYEEYGDGHHRLAAAIDAGFTHVPVEAYKGYNISYDSGCWDGRRESIIEHDPRLR